MDLNVLFPTMVTSDQTRHVTLSVWSEPKDDYYEEIIREYVFKNADIASVFGMLKPTEPLEKQLYKRASKSPQIVPLTFEDGLNIRTLYVTVWYTSESKIPF